MLARSKARTSSAVFFDPTGRRRIALRATLVVVMCVAAALIALVLIGLRASARAPRTFVSLDASSPGSCRERERLPERAPSVSCPASLSQRIAGPGHGQRD
jgi:hypothetical protein